MASAFRLDFGSGRTAVAVHVRRKRELPAALGELGLDFPRPVVVVVGGAAGLSTAMRDRLRAAFERCIVPVIDRFAAAGVDGGTQAGVMQLFGESRAAADAGFPLVGVVAATTIHAPGDPSAGPHSAVLEPHHTHFVVVPGDRWGDEAPWIAHTATALAGGSGSVTLLVNGGEIAYTDVELSIAAGRHVVVVAGSGRAADELAAAVALRPAPTRAAALVSSGCVHSVPMDDPVALASALKEKLARPEGR